MILCDFFIFYATRSADIWIPLKPTLHVRAFPSLKPRTLFESNFLPLASASVLSNYASGESLAILGIHSSSSFGRPSMNFDPKSSISSAQSHRCMVCKSLPGRICLSYKQFFSNGWCNGLISDDVMQSVSQMLVLKHSHVCIVMLVCIFISNQHFLSSALTQNGSDQLMKCGFESESLHVITYYQQLT